MKKTIFYILLVLSSAVFLFSGSGKLVGVEEAIKQNQSLNLDIWFIKLIGLFELMGIIGLWLPKFRPYATICLMVIMIGAIGTHIGAAQPYNVTPATVLFALLLVLLCIDEKNKILLKR